MTIHRVSNKPHCKTLPCIHALSRRTRITCHSLRFSTEPPRRQFTLPRHQPITLKPDIDYAEHLFNVLTEIRQHKIQSGGEEYRAWCSQPRQTTGKPASCYLFYMSIATAAVSI